MDAFNQHPLRYLFCHRFLTAGRGHPRQGARRGDGRLRRRAGRAAAPDRRLRHGRPRRLRARLRRLVPGDCRSHRSDVQHAAHRQHRLRRHHTSTYISRMAYLGSASRFAVSALTVATSSMLLHRQPRRRRYHAGNTQVFASNLIQVMRPPAPSRRHAACCSSPASPLPPSPGCITFSPHEGGLNCSPIV